MRRSGGCGVVCVGGKGQARKDSKKRAVYIQPVGPARARRQRMGKAVEEGKQQGHAHTISLHSLCPAVISPTLFVALLIYRGDINAAKRRLLSHLTPS